MCYSNKTDLTKENLRRNKEINKLTLVIINRIKREMN